MVPHDKTVILWDKSKFAFVTNAHAPGNTMPGRMKGNPSPMPENVQFESDSLMIFGQQALTLESSGNLDSDSRFADLIKNGSDVHVWYNAEHYFSGMNPLKMAIPIANTDVLFKGNITAMSLNFDNGKISAKTKHYYSDEMSKIMANNRPQPISADVINRIPSSDVVAVFATNYSPNGLKELLRLLGVEGFADAYLARLNFSTAEFVNANKGEVLIALTAPRAGMDSMRSGRPGFFGPLGSFNILFATAVKDKASFDKMMSVLWGVSKNMTGVERKPGDSVAIPGIYYKTDNNWLVLSNSSDNMNRFLAGGNSNFPFVSKIAGHSMGAFVDLQRIIRLIGSMSKDSSNAIYNASLMMWQDITAKGGDFKNNISESEFEINLVDKNTNSLKQLNQYIDKLSVYHGQMKKQREAGMRDLMMENMKDSSAISPKTGTPH